MAYLPVTESYPAGQLELASYARALAHPARIAIMAFLHSRGGCFCGDIVAELPLSQSTVSQHLRELREAGLIRAVPQPPRVKYCIEKERWEMAKHLFCDFFENT